MKSFSAVLATARNQRGGVVVFVAVAMAVLIGCAALAIDLTHLYVARNELQNACDAGALAGARFLFVQDGTPDATSAVNASGYVNSVDFDPPKFIPSANQMAYEAATANKSEKVPVEVNWVAGQNSGSDVDVQRGHWSFELGNLPRGFYPNDRTAQVSLDLVSMSDLDENVNFINAVRVRARRETAPIASWLARIFGRDSFQLSADAVAWVGFAGSLDPNDSDQPIAICKQAITNDASEYDCNVGRMLNSGTTDTTHNTAGWTNFSQQPCSTANASEMRSLICNPDGANVNGLDFDFPVGAVGGVQYSVLNTLIRCWISQTDTDGDCVPDKVWNMTLPVVDCPGNNVSNCADLAGVVNVNFVWLLGNVGDYIDHDDDPLEPKTVDCEGNLTPVIACPGTVVDYNADCTPKLDADGNPVLKVGWVPCTEEFESEGGNKADDCSNVLPIVPDYMSHENAAEILEEWVNSDPDAKVRWDNFVSNYNLQDVLGNPPHYNQKTMYFFPDCKYHEPRGDSGGVNTGYMAEIPKLVE